MPARAARRHRAADREPRAARRRHRARRRRGRARVDRRRRRRCRTRSGSAATTRRSSSPPPTDASFVTPCHAAPRRRRPHAARVTAELVEIDGRTRQSGSGSRAASTTARSALPRRATVERAVRLAGELGIPLVGELDTSGAGLARRRRRAARVGPARPRAGRASPASCRPLLAVTGACVSGPALALGLLRPRRDDRATRSRTSPGPTSSRDVHRRAPSTARRRSVAAPCTTARSGVASLVVADEADARDALATILCSTSPDHHLADPPRGAADDPSIAAATVAAGDGSGAARRASYDVRDVIADVVDDDSFLELRARSTRRTSSPGSRRSAAGRSAWSRTSPRTARARSTSRRRQKAARFVAWCDSVQPAARHVRRHARLRARHAISNGAE